MKDKLQNFGRKWWKDIATVVFLFLAITILLMHYVDFEHMDMSIPFYYQGNDDLSSLVTARLIQDSGWNFGTDELSYPDEYYSNTDEIIAGLHNTDILITKFFLVVTHGDVAKSVNLLYLSVFYMIAYVAYIVLRQLRVREWLSAGGALVYAFLPFAFMRNVEHLTLTSYYFVPLAILMAVWIYEDEFFMLPGKDFFRYKKNYAGLVMAFLIANEGIGYWQIFACFYVFVAALTGLIRNKDKSIIKRGLMSLAAIVFFVILACIPEFYTMMAKSSNGVEGRLRNIGNSEVYCLKIIQLFLPVNGHHIQALEDIIEDYNTGVPLINENQSSYLGIIGIIGFLFLLVWLFTNKKEDTPLKKRLNVLADMNICTLVLATIGGFGTIIFVLGIQIIRGYNRISVFIAFICIMAVCLLAEELAGNLKKMLYRTFYAIAIGLIMLLTIVEQNPETPITYEENAEKWNSDAAFIQEIETQLSEGAAVFQLPYVDYPESAGAYRMAPLSHYIGYIHSARLKWSFGSMIGTETAEWYEQTAALDAKEMVTEIQKKGFSGIYIDRTGYEETQEKLLEMQLMELLGDQPVISEDGRLVFFKLK